MAATRVIRRLRDLQDVDTSSDPGLGASPVDDGSGTYPLTRVSTADDVSAILTSVAYVDWHVIGDPGEPGFLGGWGNAPGAWAPCRFRQTRNSTIYVEGVVSHDTPLYGEDAPVAIFKLPAEAAPGGDLMYIAPSGPAPIGPTISTVLVLADGKVCWGGYVTVGEGAEGYVSLCGVAFSIEAAA